MTIASQTSRISYTGDGVTAAFAAPFYFQVDADIVVYLSSVGGTLTLQALGTNYTLSGAGVSSGGTCTFLTAPPSGYGVVIYRDPPITQTASYNNNDPFPAKSHESALDKGTMIDQRTRDIASRSIHLPDGDAVADMALPSKALRSGKVLGFDSSGLPAVSQNSLATIDSLATAAQLTGFATIVQIATRAALKALTPVAGSLVWIKGRAADNDGGQGLFAWETGDHSTQHAIDTNEGVYIKANGTVITSGAWVRQFDGVKYFSKWFGALANGSDNSAIITTALATMAIASVNLAPTLRNEPGVKFDRTLLTFPKHGYFEYHTNDDTRQNPYTARLSQEYVRASFNANSAGIVNEFVFSGSYGPAIIVNNDKDAPGHDAYLGANHTTGVQGRVPGTYYTTAGTGSPVDVSSKTFIGMEDERWSSFYIINENYGTDTKSKYDGVKMHAYRRRQVITVDSTTGFTSLVGAKILGLTSGAFGYFISKTATTVTVDWQYSQWTVGEQLYDFLTAARPVVASYTSAATVGQHMWFGQSNGAWSVGVPPGYAITDNMFGGRVLFHPTVSFGQATVETVTAPAAVFCTDIVGAPSTGKQIVLDTGGRLVTVNGTAASTGSNAIGWVGAVGGSCFFNNSASVGAPAGSFNVASVVRNSAGLYTVNFITALLNANYTVQLSLANIADEIRVSNATTSAVSVQNYNRGTGAAADLTGFAYVTVVGGK